jgi:hypothetical protein
LSPPWAKPTSTILPVLVRSIIVPLGVLTVVPVRRFPVTGGAVRLSAVETSLRRAAVVRGAFIPKMASCLNAIGEDRHEVGVAVAARAGARRRGEDLGALPGIEGIEGDIPAARPVREHVAEA